VDVYSDWIDACDSVAKDAAGSNNRDGPSTGRGVGQAATSGDTGGFGGDVLDDDEEVVQEEFDDGF
jgi:transcription elongation factor Elf1